MGEIFYNKTVTLYNRSIEGLMGTEEWYPTVFKNARLLITEDNNASKTGLDSANLAQLFIKSDCLSKPYKKPLEWQKLSDEEKKQCFTLTSGKDFFVEGDTSGEKITEELFSYMKDKYDNCFMIKSVKQFELIPHLEIGGA